ncbi:hypothetical protein, partial [Acidithiobacillus sp.]|uniref:hypothetical protein n=1 Tax=Acidithiobacillus sp. TaxID=1872118 RepID=UPI002630A0D3
DNTATARIVKLRLLPVRGCVVGVVKVLIKIAPFSLNGRMHEARFVPYTTTRLFSCKPAKNKVWRCWGGGAASQQRIMAHHCGAYVHHGGALLLGQRKLFFVLNLIIQQPSRVFWGLLKNPLWL